MNFDEAHRLALDEICDFEGLPFDASERDIIAWQAPHGFRCWTDFPNELPRLRRRFLCVSFTLLSFRLILDTARANDLQWDGILSCETLGVYKPLPAAYETVARMLQLEPAECCMVACHTFDLDAAMAVGFRTAYVQRTDEWVPMRAISILCPRDMTSPSKPSANFVQGWVRDLDRSARPSETLQ